MLSLSALSSRGGSPSALLELPDARQISSQFCLSIFSLLSHFDLFLLIFIPTAGRPFAGRSRSLALVLNDDQLKLNDGF